VKVFVVGGTGLIGSHAVRAIVSAGHQVTGLARSEASVSKLRSSGAEALLGDVDGQDALAKGVANADTVLFTAAIGEAENAVVGFIMDKMEGTQKSLVYCSGTGVLGERTFGAWSENTFAEDDDYVSARGLGSRIQLEREVLAASKRGLGRGIVVRPPAVWTEDVPHVLITGVLDSVRKTGSACYIGQGLNMYSHVHAEDLGEVFRHAVERGRDSAVYHAVAGEVPNRWIADTVSRLTGAPARSINIDEAIEIWGKFQTLVVFGTSSRTRSPNAHKEFGWAPKHVDMLEAGAASLRGLLLEAPLDLPGQ
jgi:nucleoside-diphosphate-sugar epimerase